MDETLPATQSIEITMPDLDREVPLDYETLVAGDEQVVFFGELHTYEGMLLDLAANASALYAGGFAYF